VAGRLRQASSAPQEESASFFGKKEAKKLYPWFRRVSNKTPEWIKSFLLLFFKKEALASYPITPAKISNDRSRAA
jgi:hypothetical protein